MWDPQVPTLERTFRIVRYDTRGHGQSPLTLGPNTIEQLAKDLLELLDDLHLERIHFCGLSLGGMIGMWLATNSPSRLNKLILCNTAARIGTADIWNTRIQKVSHDGMQGVVQPTMERWFTAKFRAESPVVVGKIADIFVKTPAEGYIASCEAIRDADLTDSIRAIRVPTLVISGAHDLAASPAEGKTLAECIPGAQYVELDAAHISNVEADVQFTENLASFLAHEESNQVSFDLAKK